MEEAAVVTNNNNTGEQQQQQVDTTVVQHQTSGAQLSVNQNQVTNANDLLNEVAGEGNTPTPQQPQVTQPTNDGGGVPESQTQLQQARVAIEAAAKDVSAKGVDFSALEQEYQMTGALSADSYNKLAQVGYPKEVVDGMLNGWSAAADAFVSSVENLAGGTQGLQQIQAFVSSQGDNFIDTFNRVINSEDLGQIQMMFNGIRSQMQNTYGTSNPNLMGHSSGGVAQAPVGYETTDEMVKDMADPRYQKDMKFTKEVYQKVKYAKFF